MPPLTVVHVAGSAQWAGGEVFLKQMADRLDRSRYAMRVVCPEEGPLRDEMRRRGVPCETVKLSPLGNPFPLRTLRALFHRWNADIVQSHGARSNFYARLAAGKTPNVSTIHNALSDYPVGPVKRRLYARADAWTASRATVFACVAETLRAELVGRIPSAGARARVLHNGVDLDVFDPAKADREKTRGDLGLGTRLALGVVGRMTEQKGHLILLRALRGIKPKLPAFRLLFAGDGPLRESLERTARDYGLSEECVFLGVRPDVPDLLASFDLLVLPSLSEGFPFVLLEALAMRCPILATDVNGVGEILDGGRCGAMTASGDPERLGDSLLAVIGDLPQAAERAAAGRERVERLFGLDAALRRWTSLYEELAGPRRKN